MCGRYIVTVTRKELAARFAATDTLTADAPPGAVAPSQTAAVITMERQLEAQRWGLKPSWEAHSGHSVLLINARAESLTHKPTFRDLLAAEGLAPVASVANQHVASDGTTKLVTHQAAPAPQITIRASARSFPTRGRALRSPASTMTPAPWA